MAPAFQISTNGTDYHTLWNFKTRRTGGYGYISSPGVIPDSSSGALFGSITAAYPRDQDGSLFRLNTNGSLMTLHRFNRMRLWNGSQPNGLLQASDGILYGTTAFGGYRFGGVVFKIKRNGSGYEILHALEVGYSPQSALIEGSDGALYGTTFQSGSTNNGGTVFRIQKDGKGFAELHRFSVEDGGPLNPLLEASDGWLYGTSQRQNWTTTTNGYMQSTWTELAFRLTKDGTGYQVLHYFTLNTPEVGVYPGKLAEGLNSVLYGITQRGGTNSAGTLFKMNRDGTGFEIVHQFSYDHPDGVSLGTSPQTGLLRGTDGALYGTASGGGDLGHGIIFKLIPSP